MSRVIVSVVSHGHGRMVLDALRSLAQSGGALAHKMEVFLTLNLPEPELHSLVSETTWPFELSVIINNSQLGFGANHNQAFVAAGNMDSESWFLVMNPDIYWPDDAVQFWMSLFQPAADKSIGLFSPLQIDTVGAPQDFARELITPLRLFKRVLLRYLGKNHFEGKRSVMNADWINGACMVWRAEAFAQLRGFDERYFMYCEDTDICLRLQLAGWRMQKAPVTVVHDARRHTGRSWRHLRWHMASMWRLWCSAAFWQYLLKVKRQRGPFVNT